MLFLLSVTLFGFFSLCRVFTAAVWRVPALRVPLVHSLINHFRQNQIGPRGVKGRTRADDLDLLRHGNTGCVWLSSGRPRASQRRRPAQR